MNFNLGLINGVLSWTLSLECHNSTADPKIRINTQILNGREAGDPWRGTQQWHYKGALRILFQAFPGEVGNLWLSNYALRKEKYQELHSLHGPSVRLGSLVGRE